MQAVLCCLFASLKGSQLTSQTQTMFKENLIQKKNKNILELAAIDLLNQR